ncbi:hypothetical protein [Streptomyces sp. NPDC059918]
MYTTVRGRFVHDEHGGRDEVLRLAEIINWAAEEVPALWDPAR